MSFTDLRSAAQWGDLEQMKYLIENEGCNPHIKDGGSAGQTPLHRAAGYGHQAIVEYLIDNKQCDPNCRDNNGWTPLHWACSFDHQAIVEYLVDKKHCDPNCRDNTGWTPLHEACREGNEDIVKYLIGKKQCDPNCRDDTGMTPLHHACLWKNHQVVSFLLLKCDPNIAAKDGRRPLSLVSDTAIMKELIKFGATADIADVNDLPGLHGNRPASSIVKTFVVGDPEAGKTTLTEAIKSEASGIISNLSGRLFKVLKTNERTAGIVPHHFESRHFGGIILYDLAGHREFYASHDTLLQGSVPGETAVYLIVVDLSKSDEDFQVALLYWLSFINNCSSSCKQHAIIVGSHADQIHSEEKSRKAKIVETLSTSQSCRNLHLSGFVAVDCRYAQSDPMGRLRQYLKQSYEALRSTSIVEIRTHCFLVYLLEKNPSTPAITLGSVIANLETERDRELVLCIPQDACRLVAMCKQLSVRGNILFFNNDANPANSIIVLDQAILFSKVIGTIFAPEGFKQHAALASSTGVVPLTKLASQFPDINSDIIVQFLCQLQFCHEVSDPDVLQLLQACNVATDEERFYFFPGLVNIQAPGRVWVHGDNFIYHCGWLLQSEHFLTPRFIQVLILRLAFSFALAPRPLASFPIVSGLPKVCSADIPTIHRRCSVWKNGIYWANMHGAKALVEVSTDSKRVTVLIRCQKGCMAAATELRSAVIRTVLQTKDEFCSAITCHESLLDASASSLYPPSQSAIGIPISDIAETIVHAGHCIVLDTKEVELEDLLGFEPYAYLGSVLLKELFDEASQHYDQPMEDEFIYRIASRAYRSIDLFIEMLALDHPVMLDNLTDQGRDGAIRRLAIAIQLWRGDCHTIHQFRERLDQFSVFAGRNPLTITQIVL